MADLGVWAPLRPEEVQVLFAAAPFAWWLAGGWSLDRLAGHQTRDHADIDVQVLRPDLAHVRGWLATWDVHVADPPGSGTLRPWGPHEALGADLHDLWCRRTRDEPWRVQLMVADVEDEDWVYRRDRRVRRSVTHLVGRTSAPGLPVLAPEVQLLYKSTGTRDKDQADFARCRPLLTPDEATWLYDSLAIAAPGHPWAAQLGDAPEADMLVVLVTGLQATGKSTMADVAGEALGAPVLADDWAMSGLRPYPELQRALDDMDPPGHRVVGWSLLWALARAQLRRGSSVVLDGVARDPEVVGTRLVAAEEGAACLVVMTGCADVDLHRSRVEGRSRGIPNWYELDWEHVARSRASWMVPEGVDVALDAGEPVGRNAALLREAIAGLG